MVCSMQYSCTHKAGVALEPLSLQLAGAAGGCKALC